MAETPTSGPFKDNSRALRQINRGPSGVKGALIRVGAVLGLVASGAAIEATAHPVQDTVDTGKAKIEQGTQNIQRSKEALVNFYNGEAEIKDYNEHAFKRLSGKEPLLPGEEIFDNVKIIPAGATFEERQEMIDQKEPVNLREFPGTYTPTSRKSEVVGTLPQDTEVGSVNSPVIRVKRNAPGSEAEGDWYGFIYEKEPNNFIMAWFYADYGAPSGPPVSQYESLSANQ